LIRRTFVERRSRRASAAVRVAGWLLVSLVLCAIFAPFIARHSQNSQDLLHRLQLPSGDHWLGTDRLGRDTFTRLVYGTRVTVAAILQGVGIAVTGGVPLGLAAGFIGGTTQRLLDWTFDLVMSVPPITLALAIVGIRGPGLTNAMIAIGAITAPRFYRIARTGARTIRGEGYIEAARASGCSTYSILRRHLLRNASGPIIVYGSFSAGLVLIAEASLSFLGVGVRDPTPSWGSMIRDASGSLHESIFGIFPPSIMIACTTLAFAILGDALRDSQTSDRGLSDW
jgi:peptide/nickel transport system permease protein